MLRPTARDRRGRDPVDGEAVRDDGPPADPEAVARAICLRLLTQRAHTRAELAAALSRRGVPEDAAETVLSRFGDVGLIDDRSFAEAWVASRRRTRGLARRALASELRQRGVGAEEVADATAAVSDDDERELARALVERRLPSLARLDPATRSRRLVAMLARKGYPAGIAYSVVSEAVRAANLDPDTGEPWDMATDHVDEPGPGADGADGPGPGAGGADGPGLGTGDVD